MEWREGHDVRANAGSLQSLPFLIRLVLDYTIANKVESFFQVFVYWITVRCVWTVWREIEVEIGRDLLGLRFIFWNISSDCIYNKSITSTTKNPNRQLFFAKIACLASNLINTTPSKLIDSEPSSRGMLVHRSPSPLFEWNWTTRFVSVSKMLTANKFLAEIQEGVSKRWGFEFNFAFYRRREDYL